MVAKARQLSLFDRGILWSAALNSLRKLAPQRVARNPVMFVVEIGSVLTTAIWLRDLPAPPPGAAPRWFTLAVSIWFWLTVIFANFPEAVAEGRGKSRGDTLGWRRQASAVGAARTGT